jgi:hypothetical protein
MSGKIKEMIDTIIEQRSKGSPIIASTIKIKLILKGINPDKFTINSDDNPIIIKKIEQIADNLGVNLDSSTQQTQSSFKKFFLATKRALRKS